MKRYTVSEVRHLVKGLQPHVNVGFDDQGMHVLPNIKNRKRYRGKMDLRRLFELYDRGIAQNIIAEDLKTTKQAISQMVQRFGKRRDLIP